MRKNGVFVSIYCVLLLAVGSIMSCGGGGGGSSQVVTTGNGSIVTRSAPIVPGPVCPTGGISIDIGIDDNKNGVLDPAEVDATQNVCNGLNSLVAIVSEPSGTNCTNGGFKVTSGTDDDGDNVLDAGEVDATEYACNGAGGANGTNGNTAPIANAGADHKVAEAGIMATLDGSGSSDPDGGTLTYAWSITARPVGSLATFSNAVVSNPTFTPDKSGKYELSLVVNDGIVKSPADTVIVRAGMPVSDTGQTRWYSTAFGDDGDYTINPMSFTDNGDGTILDNVTGLTWQKCSMGQSGLDCATGTAAIYEWTTAGTTCGSFSLAGTGWRLPTDFELMTIVYYGVHSPAIDIAYFPSTVSSYYWSSTSFAPNTTLAWGVNFVVGGLVNSLNKASSYYVRCVR